MSIQSYGDFFGLNERSAVEEASRFVDKHQGDMTSNVRILKKWNARSHICATFHTFFLSLTHTHTHDTRPNG